MTTLYQCPDCHDIFEEPLSASFVLAVRCAACDVDAELRSTLRSLEPLPAAA